MNSLALQTTSYHRQYRSRTELEIDRKDLCERIDRKRWRLRVTEGRLRREMETSLRLGVELLACEERNRVLESRLHWAQRKVGHRV